MSVVPSQSARASVHQPLRLPWLPPELLIYIAGGYLLKWCDAKEWAHAYSANVSEIEFSERDPKDDLVPCDIDWYFRQSGFNKDIDCVIVIHGDERKILIATNHRDVSIERFYRTKRFRFKEDATALRWKKELRFEELSFAQKIQFCTFVDPHQVGFWEQGRSFVC